MLQKLLLLLAPLALFAAPLDAQQPETGVPPLSAYGELPQIERAALSPSGERIAALMTVNGQRMIALLEGGGRLIMRYNVDEMKIRRFDWVGEQMVLLVYSETESLGRNFTTDKHEFAKALVLPADKSVEGGAVFGKQRYLANAVFGTHGSRNIDGRWYGFFGAVEFERGGNLRNHFKHGRPYLYRVDLMDLSVRKIAEAPTESRSRDWLIGAQGQVSATLNMEDETGSWNIRDNNNKIIARGENPNGAVWLIGLGQFGGSVIYGERVLDGDVQWYEVPLSGGASRPFLEDQDVDQLYFDDETGHLSGYRLDGEPTKRVFFNEASTQAVAKVQRAFQSFNMSLVDWTDDLSHAIVRTSGNTDSGSWFTVDVVNLKADAFAYERHAIGPEHVGQISRFSYVASDGMEMDGILTLPPGKEPTKLPLVLLPHGGPHASDNESFDWWAQAFASRGYAVFQPNFRGSTNRGPEFRRAGYGQWGRKMQSDKSDGLQALADIGVIDPSRVCIVGASYGGYAALAGVTLQQGLYQCAVAVAPVTDIDRMYLERYRATGRERTRKVSLLEQLGPRDSWDAVSPERHAEQADAPILLIHGKDDTVVPYIHSLKMADALKDAGKPYEMVTLEGEDHFLSKSETRQLMLNAAVGFVEQHNPPN